MPNEKATKHIPPDLPASTPTRLAFVGEAPSTEEVIYNRVFVGPSGSVFDAALRAANIERSECLVTNVFDTRLPDDDKINSFMNDDKLVAENFARLNEELTYADPTVIVPMGATALWAFTGETSIGLYRGATRTATQIRPAVKLVPTFHPSAIIRDWRLLSLLSADFAKASREADIGPKVVYPRVELLIEPSLADVLKYVDVAKKADILSVDIETGWGQITAISFAHDNRTGISIPFLDLRKPSKSYWLDVATETTVWKAVKEICESPVPKLGQNFAYDATWLWALRKIKVRNYRYDTRLAHKTLWSELPADLANMAATYTDIGAWKAWAAHHQKKEAKQDG